MTDGLDIITRLPVGVFRINGNGNCVFVNPSWCELTNMSEDAALGDGWSASIHPDDRPALLVALGRATHNTHNEPIHIECRISTAPELSEAWVLVQAIPVREDEGPQCGFVGTLTDITSSRLTRNELRRTQASLAEAQRMAQMGNWDWNVFANTLTWSDEVYRIFGAAPSTAQASPEFFYKHVHTEDLQQVQDTLEAAVRTCSAFEFDHRIRRADGVVRLVHVRGELASEQDGAPLRIHGTIQDVTDARRAEQELRQSQRLEALGRLAGGVAHNFNNLLQVIAAAGYMLDLNAPDDAETAGDVAAIREATASAAALTQQLLAFGRQQALAPEVVELGAAIDALQPMLTRLLREDIELRIRTSTEPCWVSFDTTQLEQVLVNLSLNARDALPKGGKITFRTAIVDADRVSLAIQDDGAGMSADVMEQIFDPFFSTKSGVGLGLATVHGIVQRSGGQISVDSAPGKGTRFTIVLDRVHLSANAPPETDAVKGTTVLVVEDEELVRLSLKRVLQAAGYNVLTAESGKEALRVIDTSTIDILLSDVVMPGMTGNELAVAVQQRCPQARIVLMSGYPPDVETQRGIAGGTLLMLPKPIRPEHLLNKLAQHLEHG